MPAAASAAPLPGGDDSRLSPSIDDVFVAILSNRICLVTAAAAMIAT
jgi:hypothetical protein